MRSDTGQPRTGWGIWEADKVHVVVVVAGADAGAPPALREAARAVQQCRLAAVTLGPRDCDRDARHVCRSPKVKVLLRTHASCARATACGIPYACGIIATEASGSRAHGLQRVATGVIMVSENVKDACTAKLHRGGEGIG